MTRHTRVVVAEDDGEVRAALVDLLATEAGLELVGTAATTEEALTLATLHHPDVVVMDVKIPQVGGAQATRLLRRQLPDVAVVALSAHEDRHSVLEMLAAGVVGYLSKTGAPSEIVGAVRRAADGESVLSATPSATVVDELAGRLQDEAAAHAKRAERQARIRAAVDGELAMAFQVICDLASGATVGVEALARFDEAEDSSRTPDQWFAEAAELGMRRELEAAALGSALQALPALRTGVYLSINVTPEAVLQSELRSLVRAEHTERLVLELTEHEPVHDYGALAEALAPLRRQGTRLAVDDAGAGFASLRHIALLDPDLIKVDASLVSDVGGHRVRRALVSALASFADEIGAQVVAEGIEQRGDLEALRALGVDWGQGYLFGAPAALADLQRSVSPARES